MGKAPAQGDSIWVIPKQPAPNHPGGSQSQDWTQGLLNPSLDTLSIPAALGAGFPGCAPPLHSSVLRPPASASTSQGGSVLKETDIHTKFSRPQDSPAHTLSHCLQVGRMGHWAETWSCIPTLPSTLPPTSPIISSPPWICFSLWPHSSHCTMGLLPLCLGLVGGHIHIKDACSPLHCAPCHVLWLLSALLVSTPPSPLKVLLEPVHPLGIGPCSHDAPLSGLWVPLSKVLSFSDWGSFFSICYSS